MHQRRIIVSVIATLLLLAAWAPATPAASVQTVTLSVDNMTCALCPITVRKALECVEGVQSVRVDFETKTVTVTYGSAVTTVTDLTTATANAGYPSRRLE